MADLDRPVRHQPELFVRTVTIITKKSKAAIRTNFMCTSSGSAARLRVSRYPHQNRPKFGGPGSRRPPAQKRWYASVSE